MPRPHGPEIPLEATTKPVCCSLPTWTSAPAPIARRSSWSSSSRPTSAVLSAAERQIVQRAAVLGAMAADAETRWLKGEPIDLAGYCTLVNAQQRALLAVGLQRRARDVTPSLREYLKEKAAPAE
jgi:hypothetical protein